MKADDKQAVFLDPPERIRWRYHQPKQSKLAWVAGSLLLGALIAFIVLGLML